MHSFIFKPGQWLGEGKIILNMMDEAMPFYTKWNVPFIDGGGILECTQEIQIAGLSELMMNEFSLYDIGSGDFLIELENQSLGKVVGSGLIGKETIAWEFRLNHLGFEGFEFYQKIDENTYKVHAEYATTDEFRTIIHGKIWLSTLSSSSPSAS